MTTDPVDAAREASPMLQEWVRTGQWPPSPEPPGGWTPPRLYEAIYREVEAAIRAEAEARAAALDEARAAVEALERIPHEGTRTRCLAAIDALREGADKA